MANESLIRKYLLGDLPAEERSRIEDEYFADADLFEELVSTENDLVDSYVRGGLSEAEKQQFERKYRTSPDRIARIGFAKALAQVSESEKETASADRNAGWNSFASFLGLLRPQLSWALAVTTVLAVVGVSLLGVQNYRLQKELRDTRADATQLRQREGALRAQIAALSTQEPPSPEGQEGSQVARLEPPADLSFRLVPGVVRGGTIGQRDLVIPHNGAWMRLEMVLDRDEFKSYEAVLQSAEGKEVLRAKGLKSNSIRGNRVVRWRLSSYSVPSGDYAVRLRGERDDASVEEAESYSFRVSRR
jgi:hypothetical protein